MARKRQLPPPRLPVPTPPAPELPVQEPRRDRLVLPEVPRRDGRPWAMVHYRKELLQKVLDNDMQQ